MVSYKALIAGENAVFRQRRAPLRGHGLVARCGVYTLALPSAMSSVVFARTWIGIRNPRAALRLTSRITRLTAGLSEATQVRAQLNKTSIRMNVQH
jgi:hypothetical protein